MKKQRISWIIISKIRETNIEDWYIELHEEFSCENKEQLNKQEGEIIREIGRLNKKIAGRTEKEYYEDNRNKILEYKKEYYEKNREYKKAYREANKDKIKEYNKEYYHKNQK